ncbi:hypothetical protein KY290_003502 [Solanum tuberosum]|uniref:Uncharacterized protein n=1 Tax=Solanum tuberosum TaxID=4113 RepID=A0ABQ7WT35_SOLTU|nr:hypothetical protein KY285_004303 [Solanum tuberosum]KAH0783904.1 hypothetical protein KY290_003502 [Solanum tuberosum]
MKHLDSKDLASSLPVLPRLDRLDFLLQVLEEKHGMSPKNEKGEEENSEYCRSTLSLSTALEEVHHKGTLVDRLTALENRVFKLSLEMEEEKTSRSSSSKSRNHDNEDEKANLKHKQLQEEASTVSLSSEKSDKVVGNAKMTKKKWRLGSWLRLGCN